MSGIGMMCVSLLIVLVAITIVKLAPVYLTGASVGSIVTGLEKDPTIREMSTSQVRKTIHKRLNVNGITLPADAVIKIKRQDGTLLVEISYEERTHLYGNMDVVMSFSHVAEIHNYR
tara:strand:- start:306 stop:656 length:351 start_codon:yes stop_codon:yes gene_type:complete